MQRKTLPEVMFFNDKHTCRCPYPFEAAAFELDTKSIQSIFKGFFEMTARADPCDERGNDENKSAVAIEENSVSAGIIIRSSEISGASAVSSASQLRVCINSLYVFILKYNSNKTFGKVVKKIMPLVSL